ncbi:FecR family protein [Steroidobacter sp.]|uniref:FecR family protein n=1 Tax=Steroidobacter sp. TaxID=1978227 RepID=UPI001A5778AD|nr:FecR domain-containing protein [Steroidobacter sp.]MBL8266727.1 FecR domain-containing protein [Steroidobacter sp.]
MSDHRRAGDNRQILEEASQWFVDFRSKKVDQAQRDQFMRWLRRSPEHIRAYIEIGSSYARLPGAGEVQPGDIERLLAAAKGRANVLPLAAQIDTQVNVVEIGRPSLVTPRRRSRVRLAAAVALVSVCAALATWFTLTRAPVFATQIAERRSITLKDGSRIELNADSRVRIEFSDTERGVDLLEGQALFHVAKDANRPFVVRSAGAQIRAVGTQFDVYRKRQDTVVTVLEGRVAVLDPKHADLDVSTKTPGGDARVLLLVAGEQAVINSTAVKKPKQPNVAVATAWTHGEYEFDETALADVVAEFNRHSHRAIVLESPAIANFKISGLFSFDDPASLIRFLRNQPELTVIETEREIRIRKE